MLPTTVAIFIVGILFQVAVVKSELYDIVQTAINNGNFKTLVTALQAADLVPALKRTGPFTVFAPTDDAFAKLPAGFIADLLKPENKPKLIRVLLYHVVAGNLTAAAIIALNPPVKVPTLEGRSVLVTKDGDKLKVNNSTVIIADVFATNGIIHAIDTVLLPPSGLEDIVDTAVRDGHFKILVTLLQAADLADTLRGPGPFTVFAPFDEAFERLPPGFISELLKPENKPKLIEVLKYHVVAGNLTAGAIIDKHPPIRVATLADKDVLVTVERERLRVNEAFVVVPNVFATNGIIHVIDGILVPRQSGLRSLIGARK